MKKLVSFSVIAFYSIISLSCYPSIVKADTPVTANQDEFDADIDAFSDVPSDVPVTLLPSGYVVPEQDAEAMEQGIAISDIPVTKSEPFGKEKGKMEIGEVQGVKTYTPRGDEPGDASNWYDVKVNLETGYKTIELPNFDLGTGNISGSGDSPYEIKDPKVDGIEWRVGLTNAPDIRGKQG